MEISVSWQKLCDSVHQAAERSGRKPEDIRIILVTKTVEEKRILEAWKAGAKEFGENRVQELLSKKKNLPEMFRWHFIGHLQTNKVNQVISEVVLIHSLDREELAKAIDSQAKKLRISQVPCLIQVNMSGEATKFGFAPDQVEGFLKTLSSDSAVEIKGLMALGPNTEDEGKIREVFRETRKLRDVLAEKFPKRTWNELSMGMSDDYPIAIAEGATMIRIGAGVFGERK